MSHFDEALAHVLKAEGGYLESASEHGGGAMRGVSLVTLQEYRKDITLTLEDLQKLTAEEAREIYRVRFWDRIAGDDIKGRLTAIVMLDQAVNRGVRGLREGLIPMLEKRFKVEVIDDSFKAIVPKLNEYEDMHTFVEICANAQHHYVRLAIKSPEKFLSWQPGWLNRIHNLLRLLT